MVKTTSLLFVFLLSLGAPDPPDKRSIRCFTRSFHLATADSLGNYHTIPTLLDDERVFVCGDLRMIEDVTHFMEHRPPDTDRYEDLYSYLVFEKDSLTGIVYQAKWPDSTRRRTVEPVTKARMSNDTMVVGILGRQPHLVSSVRDPNTGMLTEIYTRLGNQPSDRDTCRLFYSKPSEGLPFFESLSPYLDSARGARLFEVRCTFDSGFSERLNRWVGKSALLWKVEENAFFNRDSIYGYFARYARECRGTDGR
jgi:hypothetical protein